MTIRNLSAALLLLVPHHTWPGEVKPADESRKAEVKALVQPRLHAVAQAIMEFNEYPTDIGGWLGTPTSGRSASWCEALLEDVMAQKNVEVVDDERSPTPAWDRPAGTSPPRKGYPVVDPDFDFRVQDKDVVVNGYVTLWWKQATRPIMIVVRIDAPCAIPHFQLRCGQRRYTTISVYDHETPVACSVLPYDPRYWSNWKNSVQPMKRLTAPRVVPHPLGGGETPSRTTKPPAR